MTRTAADRAGIHPPLHVCPACGAALDIQAGTTFSVMPGASRVRSLPYWCSACGQHLRVTFRLSGSTVKIDIKKAA